MGIHNKVCPRAEFLHPTVLVSLTPGIKISGHLLLGDSLQLVSVPPRDSRRLSSA